MAGPKGTLSRYQIALWTEKNICFEKHINCLCAFKRYKQELSIAAK
jgi:hypothetical protein